MEAGVDEANAYTYAALFFLGGLLVMTVLDRLPMNIYRAIIYEVCFRTVIITLDHLYLSLTSYSFSHIRLHLHLHPETYAISSFIHSFIHSQL